MFNKLFFFLIVIDLVFLTGIYAQKPQNRIECLARIKQDSILLRWVPASIPVWQTGNMYGYHVYRYRLVRDGLPVENGLSEGTLLTPEPLKPYTESQLEGLSAKHPEADILAETIYGKEFQLPDAEQGFTGFLKSYREMETRFGFSLFVCDLSTEIAKAAGLFFADPDVKPGERYAYRIVPASQPEGLDIAPGVMVVDAGIPDKIPAPDEVRAMFSDRQVLLRWPVSLHRNIFTAYILEKSTDGTHFHPVSDLPLVNASENSDPDYFIYTDSLAQNGVMTWYRLKGVTPFGEHSRSSATVSGMGAADFSAYAVIDTCFITDNHRVEIRWGLTETTAGEVKKITVQRAPKADGPYSSLSELSPGTFTYTDSHPAMTNYYRIMLRGDNDRLSLSFPHFVQLEDNDPPAPPSGLSGAADTTGLVTLIWKDNAEPDIAGYRVFRANALHEEWVEITRAPVKEAFYRDSINLNTLTKDIYYCLTAIDKRYNNSEYSEPARLTRPDTIAPAPAIILVVEPVAGKIQIRMEESPSSDVAAYELFRTPAHDTIMTSLQRWEPGRLPVSFTDLPDENGNFSYRLLTYDRSGNKAENGRTCRFDEAPREQVTLSLNRDKASGKVYISWQMPGSLRTEAAVLYKAAGDVPLTTYRQAGKDENQFIDEDTEAGTEYAYRLKVIMNNGKSVLSPVKKITVK